MAKQRARFETFADRAKRTAKARAFASLVSHPSLLSSLSYSGSETTGRNRGTPGTKDP